MATHDVTVDTPPRPLKRQDVLGTLLATSIALEAIVVNGIPFNVVETYTLSGRALPLDELIDWAEDHGTFRREKLLSTSTPQIAAEKLIAEFVATDFARFQSTRARKMRLLGIRQVNVTWTVHGHYLKDSLKSGAVLHRRAAWWR